MFGYKNVSSCKNCILTGMASAMAAGALTAMMMAHFCSGRRQLRRTVNHALKALSKNIEDMLP